MSFLPGARNGPLTPLTGPAIEHVTIDRPLQRLLAFSRRSIDDVVNCPIAKNEVFGYYKLHKSILRQSEIRDLERQWNPLGRMT